MRSGGDSRAQLWASGGEREIEDSVVFLSVVRAGQMSGNIWISYLLDCNTAVSGGLSYTQAK